MAKKKVVEFNADLLAQITHSNEVRANVEAEKKKAEAIRKAGIDAIERVRTFA